MLDTHDILSPIKGEANRWIVLVLDSAEDEVNMCRFTGTLDETKNYVKALAVQMIIDFEFSLDYITFDDPIGNKNSYSVTIQYDDRHVQITARTQAMIPLINASNNALKRAEFLPNRGRIDPDTIVNTSIKLPDNITGETLTKITGEIFSEYECVFENHIFTCPTCLIPEIADIFEQEKIDYEITSNV